VDPEETRFARQRLLVTTCIRHGSTQPTCEYTSPLVSPTMRVAPTPRKYVAWRCQMRICTLVLGSLFCTFWVLIAPLPFQEQKAQLQGARTPPACTAFVLLPTAPDSGSAGGRVVPWARWDEAGSADDEWFGDSVMRTKIAGKELSGRMARFCLDLAYKGGGRIVSNAGGFQSKDVTWSPEPALQEFFGHLHEPLAAFLRRQLGGRLPSRLRKGPELGVVAAAVDMWANMNSQLDRNVVHNHGVPSDSVVASGVYYPEMLPDKAGVAKLRFFVPEGKLELEPVPGTLLLFRTDLLHETETVSLIGKERLSFGLNVRVRWLDSPILLAAAAGDLPAIHQLAEQGADINEGDPVLGIRAVHLAAEGGHLDALIALEELGADINALAFDGSTALGLAFDRGHTDVEQHLFKGSRRELQETVARVGLPPKRPPALSSPGVPVDRWDVKAAFKAAGIKLPGTEETEVQDRSGGRRMVL